MPGTLVVAAGQMGPASDDKTVNVETLLRLMDEGPSGHAVQVAREELLRR